MMKKLFMFLLLVTVVTISGCIGQGPTITGGPGIVITDLSVDYTPIYAGDQVGWNLEVQNQGEYDTSVDRVTWFGIDLTTWGFTGTSPDTTSHAVTAADPVTGFEGGTWFTTETITSPSTIASTTSFDLGVRIEYTYQTDYTATIRVVDPTYLRTLSKEDRDAMIRSGGIRESQSTAAPIDMKAASGAHFIARGADTPITIPFRVTNVGPGLPYRADKSSATDAVADGLYEIQISSTSGIDCTGAGNIILSRGKNGGFGCILTVPGTVANFEDRSFSLTLRYRYYVDGSTSLTVNPQYGGPVPTVTTTTATTTTTT